MAAASQSPVLDVRALRRSFGGREVLSGVDLSIARGERVALCGPNGSGKSTLLRCVLGTVTPDGGSILVDGAPAGSTAARGAVGAMLSQDRSFYLRLSGRDNLLFFARLRLPSRRQARAEVERIVEELGIEEIAATRASRCSTGMLQMLGFARALLGWPPLLLLDETTRSLDAGALGRLWAALDRREGVGVLLATHRDEDRRRCDRVHALGR